jgi:hypothetical protein
MKRKLILIAAVLALVAGAGAYYALVPGHVPEGQPPVARLDPGAFEQQFRAASTTTRVLALLSPT